MTRSTALTSWKEIAHYLGKSVRTVQRWEHEFGLPVRRPTNNAPKSVVLIETADLDRWMHRTFHRVQLEQAQLALNPYRQNTFLVEQAANLVREHHLVILRTQQIRME